ncbi:MAG: DNA polymerase III subunit delta [Bacteroidales bacterium]|nr:DNA polymerase III subunit delta [Bacteroidales bacterium]
MKFADVIGLDSVKQRLVKTVRESRVSHAQLFIGPQGTGKLPMALAYAQFINCTNKQDNDSCGECPSCIKYEKLVHPDLHFIYPTAKTKEVEKPTSKDFISHWRELINDHKAYINLPSWYEKIGIERKQAIINARDCNDIIKTLGYKSYEADYKVMIIWMVEKLFHAAAPKILKILEEPPDKTLFILISDHQDQIINTILSRTQIVKFPFIGEEDLTEALLKEGFEQNHISEAIKISKGNYLEVKKILAQVDEADINTDWFTKWMRLCFGGQVSDTLDFVSELSKHSRDKQKAFLNYTLRMVRESMLMNSDTSDLVRLNKTESDFIIGAGTKRFYPYIHSKNIHPITEELEKSIYHIERNANPNILFFDLSLKIGRYLKS